MSFLEEMEAMRRREEAFRLLLLECLAEMEAEAGRLSVEAGEPLIVEPPEVPQ